MNNKSIIDYRSFPPLYLVVPRKRQKLGVKYAYIEAARSTAFAKDGWRVTRGTHPFEVEDTAYVLMEYGDGQVRDGCFRHQILIEDNNKVSRREEAAA